MRNAFTVLFWNAVHINASMCIHSYPNKRIEEVLTGRLSSAICSRVPMFLWRKLQSNLTDVAQFTNSLLERQHGKLSFLEKLKREVG